MLNLAWYAQSNLILQYPESQNGPNVCDRGVRGQIETLLCTHIMEYYLAIKKNGILISWYNRKETGNQAGGNRDTDLHIM